MARRILIVDDFPHMAELLARLMTHFGHNVRTATDGLQAIVAAEEFGPEVVLLDIGLPILNGFEVAKRMRHEPWSKGVLLIALAGQWTEEYQQLSKEAGFDGHLAKPAATKDILDLVENLSRVH